ncbi:ribosome biogenesis GTPase Der [Buchnera aphidicola (Hyadaphis tataricae)]|uniref:GTPase Der n=1 Tax=Buchnera aphidicola (Hyadaphis tataricae) TaxID=1241859 RepID=A0A4D6Y013_9GAMM|nr:ribosome biogenesis GTPase Der [Buchnera aphidicola]QCI21869.1 ribosome biogenesis GTPase Der [Buchnera aphidicola (Hyadaphis tataricae)]
MIPIIVLIGRTNVGKSSLFNILTNSRNALVSKYSGLTRDRQYGYCELKTSKQKILFVDTAGLDVVNSNEIEKKAYQQSLIAIEEANLILFIVSARDGLMPQETEIINIIRKYKKEIILVINKIDGMHEYSKINEFYSLGLKTIQKTSATHNQGINLLFANHLIPFITLICKQDNAKKSDKQIKKITKPTIKIALIGQKNVGKSTLLNCFLKDERMITCNIPGTTLDSISTSIQYNNQNYIFTDTAGISKKSKKIHKIENISIIKTLQTIEKSHVVLFIIDASKKICHQDLFLANFILNAGKSIVVVINKWDLLNNILKRELKQMIKTKLRFLYFAKIHFISALYDPGIHKLFTSIKEAYNESNKKISTSTLMNIMKKAIHQHQPPIFKGRRIKLKYAHLGSSAPPKIIIHGNQVDCLSLPYKRYLMNFFHHSLNITGTPIQIRFKNNINPYLEKKQTKN